MSIIQVCCQRGALGWYHILNCYREGIVRVQDLAEVGMRDALSWAGASFMLASAGLKTVFNQAQWPILHVEYGDRKIAKSLRTAQIGPHIDFHAFLGSIARPCLCKNK